MVALPSRSPDLALNLFLCESENPRPDIFARAVIGCFAVRLEKRVIDNVVVSQLLSRQVAPGFGKLEHMLDEIMKRAQVGTHQREERVIVARNTWSGRCLESDLRPSRHAL